MIIRKSKNEKNTRIAVLRKYKAVSMKTLSNKIFKIISTLHHEQKHRAT